MLAPDEGGALFQPELQYVAMGEALMWSISASSARRLPRNLRGRELGRSCPVWFARGLSSIRQSIFRQHE
jgi:hypothetical protein